MIDAADGTNNDGGNNTYWAFYPPGITVNPTSGLTTTEAGGTAQFDVVLDAPPTADVTIGISSSDTGEGTVSTPSLTFTAENWDTPQTVTITGQDDDLLDGDIAYTILTAAATSSDPNYNGMDADDVSVANTDLDTAEVTISANDAAAAEPADNAQFTVTLSKASDTDTVISYTISGDATADSDYTALSGQRHGHRRVDHSHDRRQRPGRQPAGRQRDSHRHAAKHYVGRRRHLDRRSQQRHSHDRRRRHGRAYHRGE